MGMTREQLQEFVKCKSDPAYFIETYCKIQHPLQGLIPFKLYDFQKDILKAYQTKRFNITNKSRQTGLSTLTSAYALWLALFHKKRSIIIISIKDDDAQDFLRKIKIAYYNLPEWLKDEPVTDNKHVLEFTSGSIITSVASGSQAARGRSPSLLIIDECAFIPTIEEIWTSAYPTLSRGGSAIIISTPNGIGNFFYKTFMNASPDAPPDKRNEFNQIFVHWTQVPEYRCFEDTTGMTFEQIVEKAKQGEWYKQMWPQFADNPRRWAQEFEGDFLGSGHTVIDSTVLKEVQHKLDDPKERMSFRGFLGNDPNGDIWIWRMPETGKSYIVGADVASGDGSDYSAFQILDLQSGEQVAEYQGKIDIIQYAKLLHAIGNMYNNAFLVPEANTVGIGLVQKLVYELGYTNVYQNRNEMTMKLKKSTYGWMTTNKTRPLLITALIDYVNSRNYLWHSRRLFRELGAFVWKSNGKAEADGDNNDDLIMALAIANHNRSTNAYYAPMQIGYSAEPSIIDRPLNIYFGSGDEDLENLDWLLK